LYNGLPNCPTATINATTSHDAILPTAHGKDPFGMGQDPRTNAKNVKNISIVDNPSMMR